MLNKKERDYWLRVRIGDTDVDFWQMVIFKCYLRWIIKKDSFEEVENLLGIYFHPVISALKQNTFIQMRYDLCMCSRSIKKSEERGRNFPVSLHHLPFFAVAFYCIYYRAHIVGSFLCCVFIQKYRKYRNFSCWRDFPWVEFFIHSLEICFILVLAGLGEL